MPEPGVVRQPEYQRGASLPYGGATRANQQTLEPDTQPPATPEEQFLYSPTHRPDEPLTQGAPFGPGSMAPPPPPPQTDRDFLTSAISRMQQQPLPPRVREFLARVEAGE